MLGIAFRKSFNDLLPRPFGSWMFSDSEMKDLATLVFDHEKHEQHTQSDRWHREKVNRDYFPDVILQECLPGLRWWPLDGPQNARYGSFRNRDSELLQLAVNARRTPQGIGEGQSSY